MANIHPLPPECLSCGACCTSDDPLWVEVTEQDAANIPRSMIQEGDVEPYAMRMAGERCLALDGPVGTCVVCRIYPNRPEICRAVEPGGPICMYSLGRVGSPLLFDDQSQ